MITQGQRWTLTVGTLTLFCLAGLGCEDRPSSDGLPDPRPSGLDASIHPSDRSASTKPGEMGQRHCWLITLDPLQEKEFIRLQREMPAAVKAAIREHHLQNYSVFVCRTQEDIYAIRYYDYVGQNHMEDLSSLARVPEYTEWRNACEECEVTLLKPSGGGWWAPSEEILHLD